MIDTSVLKDKYGKLSSAKVKYNKQLVELIKVATNFLPQDATLSERVYLIEHSLQSPPLCNVCKTNAQSFSKYSDRNYTGTCSRTCSIKDPLTYQKAINTKLQKYGAKVSPRHRESAKNRSNQLNKKGRETLYKKYGVFNPGQLPDHTSKAKNTNLLKYGNECYTLSQEYQTIVINRSVDKWQNKIQSFAHIDFIGIENPAQYKLELFDNPNKVIAIKCKKCGTESKLPSETLKFYLREFDDICPTCLGVHNGSKQQQDLEQYIKSLGMVVESNKQFSTESKRELDLYLPSLKLGIEFDGMFWHSFRELETKEDRNNHVNKLEECNRHNITLIRIFECEWLLKQDIVKSRLSNLVGNSTKLNARDCYVSAVDYNSCKDFLETNHIQGGCLSSHRFGLYHKQHGLVSIMTWGKPRFNKNYDWELIRFCSKLGYSIRGAASKLFSHSKTTLGIKNAISYADRRWGNGGLYRSLGFTFIRNSEPDYWYLDRKEKWLTLHHRSEFQKHKLKKLLETYDPDVTEAENMFRAGYRRIWDCGNSVWEIKV